ncbi:hypothetical protein Q2941_40675 [Bradyrhizobium sp. UFLA05-153]
MDRRKVLAGLATDAVGALVAPAVRVSAPVVTWRLQSNFPRSLGSPWSVVKTLAAYKMTLSGSKFRIQSLYPVGSTVAAMVSAPAIAQGSRGIRSNGLRHQLACANRYLKYLDEERRSRRLRSLGHPFAPVPPEISLGLLNIAGLLNSHVLLWARYGQ